ncbi:hypothetical protein [Amycolatopsis sp. cmx-11-51]|uniref:hypothetical protein n=1 Tax=Amycolatopsis sp. cmx-11-51 TaxID=2785797 RepID=UPI0039E49462
MSKAEAVAREYIALALDLEEAEPPRKQREVAKNLGTSGLSGRELAAELGLTPQRVSQLIGGSGGTVSARVASPPTR